MGRATDIQALSSLTRHRTTQTLRSPKDPSQAWKGSKIALALSLTIMAKTVLIWCKSYSGTTFEPKNKKNDL